MTTTLTILGSGTISHQKENGSAGLLLVTDKTSVLFDSGPGTLYRLAIAGVSVHDLDLVCYTHNHPDHITDLPALLQTYRWDPQRKDLKDFSVIGPESVHKTLEGMIELFGKNAIGADNKSFFLNKVHLTASEKFQYKDLEIESFKVFHTSDSLGYKIKTKDAAFIYTGDMGYCGSDLRLFKDVDVIVIECSFPSGTKTNNHLTPALVKRIVRKSNAKKIILNHIYPHWSDEEYSEIIQMQQDPISRYLIAEDFMKISIDEARQISIMTIQNI